MSGMFVTRSNTSLLYFHILTEIQSSSYITSISVCIIRILLILKTLLLGYYVSKNLSTMLRLRSCVSLTFFVCYNLQKLRDISSHAL